MKNSEHIKHLLSGFAETRRNQDSRKLKAPEKTDAKGYDKDTYERNNYFYQENPDWQYKIRNALYAFIANNASYPYTRLIKFKRFVYASDQTCIIRAPIGSVGKKEVISLVAHNRNVKKGSVPIHHFNAQYLLPNKVAARPKDFTVPIGTLYHKVRSLPYEPLYQACNACSGTGYVKCLCCNYTNPCSPCDGTGVSKHFAIGSIPEINSWITFTHQEQRRQPTIEEDTPPPTDYTAKIWGRHAEILLKAMEAIGATAIRFICITDRHIRIRFVVPNFPGAPSLLPTIILLNKVKQSPIDLGLPPAVKAILNKGSKK